MPYTTGRLCTATPCGPPSQHERAQHVARVSPSVSLTGPPAVPIWPANLAGRRRRHPFEKMNLLPHGRHHPPIPRSRPVPSRSSRPVPARDRRDHRRPGPVSVDPGARGGDSPAWGSRPHRQHGQHGLSGRIVRAHGPAAAIGSDAQIVDDRVAGITRGMEVPGVTAQVAQSTPAMACPPAAAADLTGSPSDQADRATHACARRIPSSMRPVVRLASSG